MSNKKLRKPVFLKAKELLEYGLSNSKVSEILEQMGMSASMTTISGYRKFNTYEEYSEATNKRLAKYKTKPVLKTTEPKPEIKSKDDTWFKDMLSESKKQTVLLEEISELLNKRRIF